MFPTIATVGDNCMDVYENTGKAYPGGNPVNVAVYFVRMGGQASYTGIVGDDVYGRQMVEAIRAKGVDVSHVRTEPGTTAVTHVELIDGERVMGDYEEGVMANFSLREEDIDFLGSQDIVVTALWGEAHPYLSRIREKGALIAYDAATRPLDPAAQAAIHSVDYFFFSVEDGDTPENRDRMIELYEQGPELVVMTMGAAGSLAYDGEDFTHCGVVSCDVVDTMGAGDSYIAGFLMGISRGANLYACMQLGALNAAETIAYHGAW